MDYGLKFSVKCSSPEEAVKLHSVLLSENNVERDRSSYGLMLDKKDKSTVLFDITAKDATALRASLNGITTNLQIFEKSKGLK